MVRCPSSGCNNVIKVPFNSSSPPPPASGASSSYSNPSSIPPPSYGSSSSSTVPNQIQCDKCRTICGLPPGSSIGSMLRCPTCSNVLTVKPIGGVPSPSPPSSSSSYSQPPSNTLQCDVCRSVCGIPPNITPGTRLRCPTATCGNILTVPSQPLPGYYGGYPPSGSNTYGGASASNNGLGNLGRTFFNGTY